MSENLIIAQGEKEEKYQMLIPQIRALVESESDMIANMANVAAALKETFGFLWVGFYRVDNGYLVLGPFQGPLACTRIKYGHGVCGTAWEQRATLVVPDVNDFPGHIACSSMSKSEIVVPLYKGSLLYAVLDIDSDTLADFDEIDARYLEQIAALIAAR